MFLTISSYIWNTHLFLENAPEKNAIPILTRLSFNSVQSFEVTFYSDTTICATLSYEILIW